MKLLVAQLKNTWKYNFGYNWKIGYPLQNLKP